MPLFALSFAPRALAEAAEPEPALGALPEWDLSDLYSTMEAPEVAADLRRAGEDAAAFESGFQGRLETLAREDPAALLEAVRRYEALEDLMGRLVSYAGLVYAGDTADPQRAKFYGDVQERITAASVHLLFFTLELNRIEDSVIEAALAHPGLARYRPWFEDIRKERPYQLEERLERLFHEKSVTSRGAWNRLFDETIAAMRLRVRGEELPRRAPACKA